MKEIILIIIVLINFIIFIINLINYNQIKKIDIENKELIEQFERHAKGLPPKRPGGYMCREGFKTKKIYSDGG